MGRTARGACGRGRALLFLIPEELGFLKYLRACRVALNEYEFPGNKIANVQSQLCKLVEKNYYLNKVRFGEPCEVVVLLELRLCNFLNSTDKFVIFMLFLWTLYSLRERAIGVIFSHMPLTA